MWQNFQHGFEVEPAAGDILGAIVFTPNCQKPVCIAFGAIDAVDRVAFGFTDGLLGNTFLLVLYALIIGRGLMIAANAPTLFSRLLAGSITLIFFTYAFVNMGMVSGILPVVGVPLPFVSYGGTALVTLFLGVGILMSIHKHRMLVQK